MNACIVSTECYLASLESHESDISEAIPENINFITEIRFLVALP